MKHLVLFTALLLAGCVIPTNRSEHQTAMVVTANPLATAAGEAILNRGGSAVDAAVAVQAVLGLVEPQSSGLGGGGFLTYYDASSRSVSVYDGRETAPAAATPDMFIKPDGEKLKFLAAKHSGLSTGVPGMVSMLSLAHQDHGRLQWADLFEGAIEHAEDGFAVSPRLHASVTRFGKHIPASVEEGPLDARNYLMDESGAPLAVGTVLRNRDYASSLRAIADDPRAIYEGELARQIVAAVSQEPRAGSLSLEDMQDYEARRQSPVCVTYRGHQVCGPPPASSWLTVAMILKLIEAAPAFTEGGAEDPLNWSIFIQAQRLAYADRDRYVADDEFVDVPLSGLLSSGYTQTRAGSISLTEPQSDAGVAAGDPLQFDRSASMRFGHDDSVDAAGTTHFVIVDSAGNVVSLTASVESIFGSTRMAGGMLLNNQLTDFSFKAVDADGVRIANRAAPGKRPRSSMSPTVVLDGTGRFLMATGSPGGSSIIAYTAKTLVGVLDWGLSPQEAVNLPNVVARRGKVRVEESRATPELLDALASYGFTIKKSSGENSGLSVVVRAADGSLAGGVDPRREGTIAVIGKPIAQ